MKVRGLRAPGAGCKLLALLVMYTVRGRSSASRKHARLVGLGNVFSRMMASEIVVGAPDTPSAGRQPVSDGSGASADGSVPSVPPVPGASVFDGTSTGRTMFGGSGGMSLTCPGDISGSNRSPLLSEPPQASTQANSIDESHPLLVLVHRIIK